MHGQRRPLICSVTILSLFPVCKVFPHRARVAARRGEWRPGECEVRERERRGEETRYAGAGPGAAVAGVGELLSSEQHRQRGLRVSSLLTLSSSLAALVCIQWPGLAGLGPGLACSLLARGAGTETGARVTNSGHWRERESGVSMGLSQSVQQSVHYPAHRYSST